MTDLQPLLRQARANLRYDEPLEAGDQRLIPLDHVRGDFNVRRFLFELGIDSEGGALEAPPDCLYFLFGGHRGCGKSTELRRLAKELHRADRYYVVLVDALQVLDINDLRYSDILLAQADALIAQLRRDGIPIDPVFLSRLRDWFTERIETHQSTRELAGQIRAGVRVEASLPFLGKLFGELLNTIRANTTYKDEVRRVVRNAFSEFAAAFNALIAHAQERAAAACQGRCILFVVDGTDRLRGDDADAFFERDIHQLKMVRCNVVYCAPIDLPSERGVLAQNFNIVRLPMIKLADKHAAQCHPQALEAMRALIRARVDPRLFTDPEPIQDYLIRHSGGHLRDLIRLLGYALAEAFGRPVDQTAAEAAVRRLATDYRRVILQEDYPLLVTIDRASRDYTPISERTRRLLYDLVLLEYNSFWWASHPAVRLLDGYRRAAAGAESAP